VSTSQLIRPSLAADSYRHYAGAAFSRQCTKRRNRALVAWRRLLAVARTATGSDVDLVVDELGDADDDDDDDTTGAWFEVSVVDADAGVGVRIPRPRATSLPRGGLALGRRAVATVSTAPTVAVTSVASSAVAQDHPDHTMEEGELVSDPVVVSKRKTFAHEEPNAVAVAKRSRSTAPAAASTPLTDDVASGTIAWLTAAHVLVPRLLSLLLLLWHDDHSSVRERAVRAFAECGWQLRCTPHLLQHLQVCMSVHLPL
jgi:hypothetical protein